MAGTFIQHHFHPQSHHRFWQLTIALLAFLLALLWARPID